MEPPIPTLAEQRIEQAVEAFRRGLTDAALYRAQRAGAATLQPEHVNLTLDGLFAHYTALPEALVTLLADAACDLAPDPDQRGDE